MAYRSLFQFVYDHILQAVVWYKKYIWSYSAYFAEFNVQIILMFDLPDEAGTLSGFLTSCSHKYVLLFF